MEVREGTEEDIPAIVDLLKRSLGEDLMPKSERYWRWKHVVNPFGSSPVLLAFEDDTLIGVRAFMRWKWMGNGRQYSAVRAVDTATHPDHQGKGIFKKLTLSLVGSCTSKGDHFVFNTPNSSSRPGYLKMGWLEAGKLPVRLEIKRPFNMVKNMIQRTQRQEMNDVRDQDLEYFLNHNNLSKLIKEHAAKSDVLTTKISPEYLKWRYLDVPVASYVAVGEENEYGLVGLMIGRIKSTKFGRELRITDVLYIGKSPDKRFVEKIRQCRKKWGVDYCTIAGMTHSNVDEILSGLTFDAPVGPIVTIRSLEMTDLSNLINFTGWSPSLGDLELF